MSEHNGAAPRSHSQRIAQLGRVLVEQGAELEALAAWAVGVEARQVELEILAAACEEERKQMATGAIWLSAKEIEE